MAAARLGFSSGFPHFCAASDMSFACREKTFPLLAFTAFLRACTTGPRHILSNIKNKIPAMVFFFENL